MERENQVSEKLMNKTTFFKGGKHHSSMREGEHCSSTREGAVLQEDAVYQERELFFEGESCSSRELFFRRADAIHQWRREDIFHQQGTEALSIDRGMPFIDKGQRTSFIEEREDSVYQGREPFINKGGRELFVKEPVTEEGSCSSRWGGSYPSRQGYRSADTINWGREDTTNRGREDTINQGKREGAVLQGREGAVYWGRHTILQTQFINDRGRTLLTEGGRDTIHQGREQESVILQRRSHSSTERAICQGKEDTVCQGRDTVRQGWREDAVSRWGRMRTSWTRWWEGRIMNFCVGKFKVQHNHMMSEFQWT